MIYGYYVARFVYTLRKSADETKICIRYCRYHTHRSEYDALDIRGPATHSLV